MSAEAGGASAGSGRRPFREELTGLLAPDAYWMAAPFFIVAGVTWGAGVYAATGVFAALGLFVVAFFRNPERAIPNDPGVVVAPADGRVLAVEEVETDAGVKGLRVAIFLSVFNVHINRAPAAGRVVRTERGGERYLAAYNPDALHHNVRLAMELELETGQRVTVTQITGLVARRIICQPQVGEWLERGVRYGLIRFGSRTDVLLPPGSRARVAVGDRVRGGATIVAELGEVRS